MLSRLVKPLLIVAVTLQSSCSMNAAIELGRAVEYDGFKTIREVKYVAPVEIFDSSSKSRVVRDWEQLSTAEQMLNLSLLESQVTISSVDDDGSLSYIPGKATRGKGRYLVTIEMSRYRTEDVLDNGRLLGMAKVGVGLRLTAEISTAKSGIDLSGLLPFAIAFERNEIRGSINAQIIGIVATDISKYFLNQTSLDRTSIERAIESFGSIRVIMDNSETKFRPHLLALSKVKSGDEGKVIQRVISRETSN